MLVNVPYKRQCLYCILPEATLKDALVASARASDSLQRNFRFFSFLSLPSCISHDCAFPTLLPQYFTGSDTSAERAHPSTDSCKNTPARFWEWLVKCCVIVQF